VFEEDPKQMSKKDKRRAKEAVKKAEMTHKDSLPPKQMQQKEDLEDDQPKGKKGKKGQEKGDPSLRCGVCKMQFDSKNKLMKHLKETGHALAPVYR
jgi:hypothetical protein